MITAATGAVAGSLAAGLLTRSSALARWEGIGVALWGAPLLLIAVAPAPAMALAALAAIGVGNALVDVGLFSLPSRLVPDELLSRVFGLFESLVSLTVALGSIAAPIAVATLGLRGALLGIGLFAPLCVVATWPQLHQIDRNIAKRDDQIAELRADSEPSQLSLPALDRMLHPSTLCFARPLERLQRSRSFQLIRRRAQSLR